MMHCSKGSHVGKLGLAAPRGAILRVGAALGSRVANEACPGAAEGMEVDGCQQR